MFRFSLIYCVVLVFGVIAKPYKPWNEVKDEAFQDVVMSINDRGKMSWGIEVEPPEDRDEAKFDIDPRMMIHKKAEEDLDELYHPSVVDLDVQVQNLRAQDEADVKGEQEHANIRYHQEPEEDNDDIDHPVFSEVNSEEPEQDLDDRYSDPLMAAYRAGVEVHVEPEKNEDELYHQDDQRSLVRTAVRDESQVRVHPLPEEDMDDLYHKDVAQPIPYQGDTEAAAPDVPSQRMYSQPEEDLDYLYHQ
uniref:uncharacterized protein si:ch211-217g15.3 n=1 Tax=Scatophagus argus TaxID=75038 RepID=UPI001ED804AC|nr:uncharacterized protein si:ch211-217g15.3 [Scatophagus argus]